MNMESSSQPIIPHPRRSRSILIPGAILALAAGFILLFAATGLEYIRMAQDPWRTALVATEGPAPWEDVIPVLIRPLPPEKEPPMPVWLRRMAQEAEDELEEEGLSLPSGPQERILLAESGDIPWDHILAEGREPEPGGREFVSGPFTRFDSFEMDGETFESTGVIRSDVGGLNYSILLPATDSLREQFQETEEGTEGWIAPGGLHQLHQMEDPAAFLEDVVPLMERTQTSGGVFTLTWLGLLAIAVGGSVLQVRLFMWLANKPVGPLRPFLRTLSRYPRLLLAMHLVHYGAFFLLMLVAAAFPAVNFAITQTIDAAFAEGDLAYIGDAYASGQVMTATGVTFWHNYAVATVGLSFAPSLVLPGIGILKNLASFSIVGLGMAPMWQGLAGVYTFHSITMILELEAYILASFAIALFFVYMFRAVKAERPFHGYAAWAKMLGSAALFVGIQLLIAAFYEAVTLIYLGGT